MLNLEELKKDLSKLTSLASELENLDTKRDTLVSQIESLRFGTNAPLHISKTKRPYVRTNKYRKSGEGQRIVALFHNEIGALLRKSVSIHAIHNLLKKNHSNTYTVSCSPLSLYVPKMFSKTKPSSKPPRFFVKGKRKSFFAAHCSTLQRMLKEGQSQAQISLHFHTKYGTSHNPGALSAYLRKNPELCA